MTKPVMLDLYSCAGGAAYGYKLAGFQTVGIDIDPQPRYAGDAFVRMNAIAALDVLLCGGTIVDTTGRAWRLSDFSAIHASPPCQGYSIMRNLPWLKHKVYPLLIEPTREMLLATGLPYVIENVAGARFRAAQPTGLKAGWLCGQMFGLPILRHRYFETNWVWMQPAHGRHWGTIPKGSNFGSRGHDMVTLPDGTERKRTVKAGQTSLDPAYSSTVHRQQNHEFGLPRVIEPRRGGDSAAAGFGHAAGIGLVKEAMGIDWMTRDELTQAIPPVMTRYLGECLMGILAAAQVPE